MENQIVSVEWLNAHINDQKIIILDASPQATVSGKSSAYSDRMIPGARLFDIKGKFSDKSSAFPNTVPSPNQFEEECQALGIQSDAHIVVYDNLGIYTSPRVWWLFKVMGHEAVSVLDGGLEEWIHKGYQTTPKLEGDYAKGDFKSKYNANYVVSYDQVIDNIATQTFTLVDARSEGRFCGTAEEPRKYLMSGHIPGSINIPFKDLLADGKFKSQEELKEIFKEKLGNSDNLVYSCGSGLTACIVMLASEIAFNKSLNLFDGSWTEYAERQNLRMDLE